MAVAGGAAGAKAPLFESGGTKRHHAIVQKLLPITVNEGVDHDEDYSIQHHGTRSNVWLKGEGKISPRRQNVIITVSVPSQQLCLTVQANFILVLLYQWAHSGW